MIEIYGKNRFVTLNILNSPVLRPPLPKNNECKFYISLLYRFIIPIVFEFFYLKEPEFSNRISIKRFAKI